MKKMIINGNTANDFDNHIIESIGKARYSIYYDLADNPEDTDDVKQNFKAQITEIHPYDEADYYFANVNGNKVDYIQYGKIKDTIYVDIDNLIGDPMDLIFKEAIEHLDELNKDIPQEMVYSTEAINADIDFEEPNYYDWTEDIHIVLDEVPLTVYGNGREWEFDFYDFVDDNYIVTAVENREAIFRDNIEVIEDLQALCNDMNIVPETPGRYVLRGFAKLYYDVNGWIEYSKDIEEPSVVEESIEVKLDLKQSVKDSTFEIEKV